MKTGAKCKYKQCQLQGGAVVQGGTCCIQSLLQRSHMLLLALQKVKNRIESTCWNQTRYKSLNAVAVEITGQ